jgi:site-specific DNA recombinase
MNDRRGWIVEDVPELCLVRDQQWHAVKDRQKVLRKKVLEKGLGVRAECARRPAYLLSTLLRCGECGGGFSKRSQHHYGCSNARNRGTCKNMLTIRRDLLEASVLAGLKDSLMDPALAREFAAEYHRELNRLNSAREQEHTLRRGELARVERQTRSIIDAIKEGIRTPGCGRSLRHSRPKSRNSTLL